MRKGGVEDAAILVCVLYFVTRGMVVKTPQGEGY